MKKERKPLFYYKLNYKQRLLRTLKLLPIIIAVIIAFYIIFLDVFSTVVVALLLICVWTIQVIYNYKKWKKKKEM